MSTSRPLVTLLVVLLATAFLVPVAHAEPTLSVAAHDSLDAKARSRFLKIDAGQAVQRQLGPALADRLGAGVLRVEVGVDEFRLRTQKQVTWGGLMSGGDFIGALVTIHSSEGEPRTIKAIGILVTGAMAGSETKRLDKIIDGLVRDIVREVD